MLANQISKNIIDEVKTTKVYTLIADEVTDVSNHEQLSICLRYVHGGNVKEVFVGFCWLQVSREDYWEVIS